MKRTTGVSVITFDPNGLSRDQRLLIQAIELIEQNPGHTPELIASSVMDAFNMCTIKLMKVQEDSEVNNLLDEAAWFLDLSQLISTTTIKHEPGTTRNSGRNQR